MKTTCFLAASIVGLPLMPFLQIDTLQLKGAWTSRGGSFEFLIQEKTILYEFDMKEHPYRLDGDTLIIQFDDAALGSQRKTIVRLTESELELKDVRGGETTVYRRAE